MIEGIAGSDKGNHAAGTHLVNGLGEKVVVNRKTELVISPVVDLVVAEWHVADGDVKEVPSVRGFKARDRDIRLGIELLGDASGDAVQLYAVQAAALHSFREHSEEVAHAHRRLQNISRSKAHIAHRIIDSLNHGGTGIVTVECGGAGRFVFLRGQDCGELPVFVCPRGLARVKGIRQTTPAHISRQHLLLIWRRCSPFGLDLLERANSRDIVAKLGFRAALAQVVVGDTKVLRGGLLRAFLLGCCVHPLNDDIIGQAVLFGGVNSDRFGGDFRLLLRLRISLHEPGKALLTFCPENGISQRRVAQLDAQRADSLDDKRFPIFQIDRIAHLIGGCLDGRLFSQIRQRLRQFRVGGLYNVAMQSVVKVVQSIVQINKAGILNRGHDSLNSSFSFQISVLPVRIFAGILISLIFQYKALNNR